MSRRVKASPSLTSGAVRADFTREVGVAPSKGAHHEVP